MYPYLRIIKELWKFRKAPPLGLFDPHVSHHRCWLSDIDPWRELNNGRTLTLFDLGRLPMAYRMGLPKILRAKRWGMTVAGNSLRYRRRIRLFDRLEMRSRLIGWDGRFFYMEQSFWREGECCSHMLVRVAVTSREGIVAPSEVVMAMGQPPQSPPLPAFAQAWIAADATRPWPPERG